MERDAVIIGGGIMGCSIAFELAKSGRTVRVIDAGPAPGAGSTSSSSAIVRFHYSTREGVAAAWESMHLWADWQTHLGMPDAVPLARFHRVGALVIEAPGDGRRERVLALFDELGVPYEEWDARTISERAPAINATRYWPPKPVDDPAFWADSDVELDGYYTPDAGFVNDPQLAAQNLAAAAALNGAEFAFNTEVVEVNSQDGRVTGIACANGTRIDAPVAVNAAGPFSSEVNAMAGVLDEFDEINTRPLRQEVHALPGPKGFRFDDGGFVVNDLDLGTYFRPHPGGTILVGGTEPECDPLIWIDDPNDFVEYPTVEVWTAQTSRLARRLPDLQIPPRPTGLGALYDVTPDWVPIYDRTGLDGYYVAIGTSGNQFKNAPLVGPILRALIDAREAGQDHDSDPVRFTCERTGLELNLGHFSRRRQLAQTSRNVLG